MSDCYLAVMFKEHSLYLVFFKGYIKKKLRKKRLKVVVIVKEFVKNTSYLILSLSTETCFMYATYMMYSFLKYFNL